MLMNKIILCLAIFMLTTSFGLVQRNPDTLALQIGCLTSVDMVISYNGNVGIGTTSPLTKLEVAGTVSANYFSGNGSLLTGLSVGGTKYYTFELMQPLLVTNNAGVVVIVETGNISSIRTYTKDGSSATLAYTVEKAETMASSFSAGPSISLSASPSNVMPVTGQTVNADTFMRINLTTATTAAVDVTIIVGVTKSP